LFVVHFIFSFFSYSGADVRAKPNTRNSELSKDRFKKIAARALTSNDLFDGALAFTSFHCEWQLAKTLISVINLLAKKRL